MNLLILFGLLALGSAQVHVSLPFANPAGVTLTGAGYGNSFVFQNQPQQAQPQQAQELEQPQPNSAGTEPQPIAQEEAQPQEQQEQVQQYAARPAFTHFRQLNAYAAPTPVQYHRAIQYAAAPVAHQKVAYAAQPAVAAVHQKVAYAAQPAVAVHQKVAYAAQPAVAVHQKVGYASTPVLTKVQGHADVPVTKLAYSHGYTQKEVDVAQPAVSTRKVKVRRPALRKDFYDIEHRVIVRPAGSATLELSQPISKEQQGPAVLTPTSFAHVAPVVRYGASRRIIDGGFSQTSFGLRNAGAAQGEASLVRNAAPQQPEDQEQAQPLQAGDDDTEVVVAAQGREDLPADAFPSSETDQPQPIQPEHEAPAQEAQGHPGQENGNGISITPDMPAALQNRLIQLLTNRGGAVTEILNQDGTPADSASVLQVAESLGDPSLQGGERVTTRRIVVTRPIETIQEIEVQEPATKIHRKIVQQPTLFKHHVPAVARVPVSVPAVKHVATPVVKTTYAAAHPAAYSLNYQTPHFSYSH